MTTARRAESNASHAAKMDRMLGKCEDYTDHKMTEHKETASHLKPVQVERIAEKVVEGARAKPRLDRAARKSGGRAEPGKGVFHEKNKHTTKSVEGRAAVSEPARRPHKAGGRAKGDVNITIVAKGDGPQSPPMIPPRAPMAPPPAMSASPLGAMPPPAGGGMPPMGAGTPPGMPMGRKKGGAVKMKDGAGGGLGRLEKAIAYGAKP